MVKTLCFNCRGAQVQSLVGELRSHKLCEELAFAILQFSFHPTPVLFDF